MRKEKLKKLIIQQLKETPIIEFACKKLSMPRSNYYRWRKEDKKFFEETENALREGILLINDLAESQLLNSIKNGNMTGIMYWLRHNSKKYANKVELSGYIEREKIEISEEDNKLMEEGLLLGMPKIENNEIKENDNGTPKLPKQ